MGTGVSRRVFISFSHDSSEHDERVRALALELRSCGCEVGIDLDIVGTPHEGWTRWMQNQIDGAAFVLLVCTETYHNRFLGRGDVDVGRGVDFEGLLITNELYRTKSRDVRFLPVVFSSSDTAFIPTLVFASTHYDLSQPKHAAALRNVLLAPTSLQPYVPSHGRVQYISVGAIPPLAPNFVDTGVLASIESLLREDSRKPVVVFGAPGVGKTQLLAEYVYRHRETAAATVWLDASSEASLAAGIRAFLERVAPADATRTGRALLEVGRDQIDALRTAIVVLDALADPNLLRHLLPVRARVLVSTLSRMHNVGVPVEVKALDERAASELLARGTGRDDDFAPLVSELGGLPLILAQAAAYISNSAITAELYRARLQTAALEVLSSGTEDNHTIVASIQTSLAAAERATDDAMRVFMCLAMFADRPMARGAALSLLGMGLPDVAPAMLERAVTTLNKFCLLRLDPEYVGVHALIARATRGFTPRSLKRYIAESCATTPSAAERSVGPDFAGSLATLLCNTPLDLEGVSPKHPSDERIASWRIAVTPIIKLGLAVLRQIDDDHFECRLAEHLLRGVESVPGTDSWTANKRTLLKATLAWHLAFSGEGERALGLAREAVSQAEQLDAHGASREVRKTTYHYAARIEYHHGDLERGLEYADRGIALSEPPLDANHAGTLDHRSMIYHRLAHHPTKRHLHQMALDDALEALRIRRSVGTEEDVAFGTANLGRLVACDEFQTDLEPYLSGAVDAARYFKRTRRAHSDDIAVTAITAASIAIRVASPTVSILDEMFDALSSSFKARVAARQYGRTTTELSEWLLNYAHHDRPKWLPRVRDELLVALQQMAVRECPTERFVDLYRNFSRLRHSDEELVKPINDSIELAAASFRSASGTSEVEFKRILRSKGVWDSE